MFCICFCATLLALLICFVICFLYVNSLVCVAYMFCELIFVREFTCFAFVFQRYWLWLLLRCAYMFCALLFFCVLRGVVWCVVS